MAKRGKHQWLSGLQIVLGAVLAFPLVFPDSFLHEAGHAIGCVMHGDRWTSISLVVHHTTGCSDTNTAVFLAGGTFFAVIVWLLGTMIFRTWFLPRLKGSEWFWFAAWFWFQWTFYCLGELVLWALQANEYPAIDDSQRFIAVTHFHPQLVIVGSLMLAVSLTRLVAWPVLRAIWQQS